MKLRWLLPVLFPIGWLISVDSLEYSTTQFTVLTVVSFLAVVASVGALTGEVRRNLHVWAILVLLLLGYHGKLYALLYLRRHSPDRLPTVIPPVTHDALLSESVVLSAYQIATAALVAVAGLLWLLRVAGALHPRRAWGAPADDASADGASAKVADAYSLPLVLAAGAFLSFVTLALQVTFSVGLLTIDGPVVLPYKLASVIQYSRIVMAPMLLLFAIWLADAKGRSKLAVVASTVFVLDAVGSSFATTSKAPIVLSIVSLAVLWTITGRFTRRRKAFFIAAVPVMVVLTGILTVSRALRAHTDLGAWEVLPAAAVVLLSGSGGLLDAMGSMVLAFLMRITGMDALLPIVAHHPTFDPRWVQQVLFTAPEDLNMVYTREVLGYDGIAGIAFSASLLGFFVLLFAGAAAVMAGVGLFVAFWHLVFRRVGAMHIPLRAVLLTVLFQVLLQSTSEGSLQMLPVQLMIIAAVTAGSNWYAGWFRRSKPARSGGRAVQAFAVR